MQDAEKNISVSKLTNSDELASTNYIFIDRVLRLSLAEKTFSLEDVLSETNTVLLAVCLNIKCMNMFKLVAIFSTGLRNHGDFNRVHHADAGNVPGFATTRLRRDELHSH